MKDYFLKDELNNIETQFMLDEESGRVIVIHDQFDAWVHSWEHIGNRTLLDFLLSTDSESFATKMMKSKPEDRRKEFDDDMAFAFLFEALNASDEVLKEYDIKYLHEEFSDVEGCGSYWHWVSQVDDKLYLTGLSEFYQAQDVLLDWGYLTKPTAEYTTLVNLHKQFCEVYKNK